MINEYVSRKVSLKDINGCLICQKPTTTVLYNKSGPDWFYTCDIHLQDNPEFVKPIYGKDYETKTNRLKSVQQELHRIQKNNDPSSWDGWVGKLFIKKNKNQSPDKDKDKDKDENKDGDNNNNKVGNESTGNRSDMLQREYQTLLDELTHLKQNNRKYQLDNSLYENRVQRRIRTQRIKETYTATNPEELAQRLATFPNVPTDKP
ncbi:Vfa1p NDAI_0B02490 [Naumovozyma dairenensis CBS 421]|uniref:VPS4-associated protein 1 n=1 Tax=Naumovozyma dairenensis (strain ATCC 10597 / BCRC 20456 / CBS 421 / NBRC 0211 / NRRL Y-12639) TaxID=1071378 RepID=G0W673_NAUDC|nr:hypothetical protein NDAI_0B02490 [Naumovozyma dairenensis CBS 421]CCD23284.1 hypothetical protein NDAI_0B02490 [Naumovozyma dairenensis CBS 421]